MKKSTMNTPAPQYDDDYKMGKGPMKAPKAPSNRNFGREDHHGTTNVRSRHIDKAVSGPGGTKHINSMVKAPPGVGPHIDSTPGLPVSHGPLTSMNDHDGDESSMLSSVPLNPMLRGAGGFS